MEDKARREIARLQQWVDDLQSGMFINCVYCGHRYGPQDKVPCAMADVLKQHIEKCPKHPMSALRTALRELVEKAEALCKVRGVGLDCEHCRLGCNHDSEMCAFPLSARLQEATAKAKEALKGAGK